MEVFKSKTSDVMLFDFAFFPKLKGEMKGRHLNDFDELEINQNHLLYPPQTVFVGGYTVFTSERPTIRQNVCP